MTGTLDSSFNDYHYLNTGYVLELVAGDLSLVQTLLSAYLVAAPEDQLRLKAAIARNDLQELKQQTHRIRGSLRYLGALPLDVLLQRIESAARTSPQALWVSYDFFQQASQQLVREIQHWQQCLMRR